MFQIHSLPSRFLYIFAVSQHTFLLIWKYFSLLSNQQVSSQKQEGRQTQYTVEPEAQRLDWMYNLSDEQRSLEETFLLIFHLFHWHWMWNEMGKILKCTTMCKEQMYVTNSRKGLNNHSSHGRRRKNYYKVVTAFMKKACNVMLTFLINWCISRRFQTSV